MALTGCPEQAAETDDPPSAATVGVPTPESGDSKRPSEGHSDASEFVGSAACAACHPTQTALWTGSDHDRAMERATAASVEGDFDDQRLRHFDETWHFRRADQGFQVELEEPGRAVRRWPVAYTFGVEPLQQYLVAFPNGRFQALPVAWDTRPAAEGGQRWFHLQPEAEIPAGDPLHWEGLAYNWNSQCAVCHSTELVKHYDVETDRYATRWAEIDVGCEACHGPGSRHVDGMSEVAAGGESGFAGSGLGVAFDAWDPQRWRLRAGARIAAPTRPLEHDAELDICAPCHSRRSPIVSSPAVGSAFLDAYRPAFLDGELYFDDGQIRDEVYVYGSFLQSRMFAAGVRCSDCHEPHSLALRQEGNALCENCHASESYGTSAHHGHDVDAAGGACVACHMPERVYMEVDGRRDHSFGLPRPARAAALGAPSACEGCHPQRGADWARAQIEDWRGERSIPEHWADGLVTEEAARDDPERWLEIALDPIRTPLVRASAWIRYATDARSAPSLETLKSRLAKGSDLERLALIEVARRLSPEAAFGLLTPLLEDPRLAVRISAAEALSEMPATIGRPADRSRLARALREYRMAQEANADRPESQVNLGVLAARNGDAVAARRAYERAIAQNASFVPAYVNLADLDRALGREEASVENLRRALAIAPEDAFVRHALGLALHRQGHPEQALRELEAAARAAPEQPRLVLAWALSLDASGRRPEAIARLSEAVERGLVDSGLYQALVTLLRDAGQSDRARAVGREWRTHFPSDPAARAWVGEDETAR